MGRGAGLRRQRHPIRLSGVSLRRQRGTLIGQGSGSTVTVNVGVTNDATGTIDAQSGTLNSRGAVRARAFCRTRPGRRSKIGGGSFTLAPGSQLNAAGDFMVNNATVTTDATDQVSIAGALTVHLDAFGSSTLNLNNAITPASVTIDGATLNANATLTTTSLTMLTHGTSFGFAVTPALGGSGTVTVTGSMTLEDLPHCPAAARPCLRPAPPAASRAVTSLPASWTLPGR